MKITRLEEACEICGVEKEVIFHFIEEDWVHPLDAQDLKLDEEDLALIQLVRELIDEYGVNEEGMSIILQLLDQLNRMHLELEKLHQGDLL